MIIAGDCHTREVMVDGRRLDPRPSQRIFNHSPDGFSWGYHGSGPAQLALALLLAAGLSENHAVRLHQSFKREHVAHWPMLEDVSVILDVQQWVMAHDRRRKGGSDD